MADKFLSTACNKTMPRVINKLYRDWAASYHPDSLGNKPAITSIGLSAAPASLRRRSLNILDSNGLIAFSSNLPAAFPKLQTVADDLICADAAEQMYCDYDFHKTKKGLGSNAYVTKRI